jgi:hypothetical protein
VISLRQHVASLVAVFLALAVGIALGGGPLASGDDDDQQGSGERDTAAPAADPTPAPDDRSGFADVFADEGAGRLYANGLDGHATAILAMPGADPAHLEALQSQIAVAGGAITGTYTVGDTLFDPAATSPIDDLTTLLIAQLVDPRVDSSAPTYERLGQLVGIAMATTEASSVRADLAAVAVRESLAGPELLTSPADVRNAPLVLVVLPPGAEGATSSLASRTILTGLTSGIAHNAAGVVVVGDETSAEDGELAALREGELTGTVSTVDGIETTIGQVTAVLALEAAIAGTSGSFGASGSDGAVPLG